jgi:hypothetical protein
MNPCILYSREGNLKCLINEFQTNKDIVNHFQECFELASFHGNRDILHKLYEWGYPDYIDIHAKEDQILYDAAIQGHIDILEDLYNWRSINHQYNLKNNILLNICKSNKINIIDKLLNWNIINSFNEQNNYIFRVLSGYNCSEIFSKIYRLSIDNGNKIDLKYDTYFVFRNACYYGQLENVKNIYYWALEINEQIDIHCYYEQPFRNACKNGNIELMKQLYNWSIENHSRINIRIFNEDAFMSSCRLGKLSIIRQLRHWDSDIDIHHNNSECFVNACKNGDITILIQLYEWMTDDDSVYKLGNNIFLAAYKAALHGHISVLKLLITWFSDIIINFFDTNSYIIYNFRDEMQIYISNIINSYKRVWIKNPEYCIDECSICFTISNTVITTPCSHKYCKECILKWLFRSDLCPFCRQKI